MDTPIRPGRTPRMWLHLLVAATFALVLVPSARAQLRIVNFNVASLNGNTAALADVFTALAADDKPGIAMAPHLYFFQEVQSSDKNTLRTIVNSATPGVTYTEATFTSIGNEDNSAGAQLCLYRDDVLDETTGLHIDIFTGGGRYTDRWHFQLDGYASPDAGFYVYGSHLKAGGSGDAQEREDGVVDIRNDADALGAGVHIIYTGDMNFGNSTEGGYQEFISPGFGQANDPLGTGTWFGGGNAWKHTQSPCNSGCSLVPGGMDDRFDFQLATDAFNDNQGLAYLAGTYRAFGNDGAHYNDDINDGNNTYYPTQIPRSNAIADDLWSASDHIPVVAEYKIPGKIDASLPLDFGRVIQGATHSIDLTLSNSADVLVATGTDTVSFTALSAGALLGSESSFLIPLGPPVDFPFDLDTTQVGFRAGLIQVSSTNQGVDTVNPSTSGFILRPSNPSFSDTVDETSRTIDWSLDPDTGVQSIDVEVYNRGHDSVQSLLDVDSVSALSAPYQFTGGLATGIGSSPAVLSFTFDTTGASGTYQAVIDIDTSDENVPGEQTDMITLTLDVTVLASCAPDFTGDGFVGTADLTLMLNNWGICTGPCDYDLTGDNAIGLADLTLLLNAWGTCD